MGQSARWGAAALVWSTALAGCTKPQPLATTEGAVNPCTRCHGGRDSTTGAPPNSAGGESATTVRGVGAHTAHLTQGPFAGPMQCGECHVVSTAGDLAAHIDGAAPVVFGPLATTDDARPSWNRDQATCAGSYCHGATLGGGTHTTPVWTRVGEGEAACGTCHGLPPPAPHPSVPGGVTACAACHPASVDASGAILAGGGHLDGKVEVVEVHPTGWIDATSPQFHGAAALQGLAPCQSCHGQDLKGSGSAPSCEGCHAGWQTSCTFCHGDTASGRIEPPSGVHGETATTTLAVGAHATHLSEGPLAGALECGTCHVLPTSALSPGHIDGGATKVSFTGLALAGGASPTFTAGTATCANTYCHGATLSGGTNTKPVWTRVDASQAACGTCHGLPPGGAHPARNDCGTCHAGYSVSSVDLATHVDGVVDVKGLTCASCHGDSARATTTKNPQLAAAPPKGTHGETATTDRAVGAHQRHLSDGPLHLAYACTECHLVPTSTAHPDGKVDLAFGALAKTRGATPVWTGTTCASSYCHGAFTNGDDKNAPAWTGTGQAACGTCHGLPPGGTHPQASECGRCHAGYSATSVKAATHANGVIDVVGLGCTSCHGDATKTATPTAPLAAAPPTGTRGETATTTRAVGAHRAHLVSDARSLAGPLPCTSCHQVPTSPSHSNGVVDLAFGGLATLGDVVVTWNGVTCAGSYCHGNFKNGLATAPSWTAGAAETACGSKCHGAPPAGTHPTTAAGTSCGACHVGYTATTVNQALHVNGVIDAPQMSCSSCHGTATVAATPLNPMLAAAPPVGTKGETATTTRAVGAHQRHLTATALSAGVPCGACHVVPAPTDVGHSNGKVEVVFSGLALQGGAAPTWNGTTCAASYCHGNFKNGTTANAPTWTAAGQAPCGSCHGIPPGGTHPTRSDCTTCHPGYTSTAAVPSTHVNGSVEVIAMTCASCHGDNSRTATTLNPQLAAAPPLGSHGETATSARAVGAHQKHLGVGSTLSRGVACTSCHVVPTSATHSDGKVDLGFGGLATTGGVSPTWNGTTCAGSYCHGNFKNGTATNTPAWTGTNQAACGSCHGLPPTGTHPTPSAGTSCGACHAGYTVTSVDAARHVNGVVDVTPLGCTSCHGNASGTATPQAPLAAAPPRGAKGETATTTRAVGAHQAHLNAGALAPAFACTQCHAVPTSTTHSNGTVELVFGALATKSGPVTWSGTTCAGSYCHGNFKNGNAANAPTWTGGAGQAACGTCHGLPPGGTHSPRTDCGTCHTGYTGTSVVTATHANGTVDVAAMTCSACHGAASRTATTLNPQLPAAPPAGTHGETAPSTRAVGAHLRHLGVGATLSSGIACASCHLVPTSLTHSDGKVDLAFGGLATTGGVTPVWNGTTCANAYCHGNFKNGATTNAPAWTGTNQAACGSCHGLPPGGTHPTLVAGASCGACHTGYTATTVVATRHINGVVDVTTLACTSCHGNASGTATPQAPLAAAPPRGTKGETATTTRAVGAHQAHLNAGVLAPAFACTQCHTVPTSTTHSNGTVELVFGALAAKSGPVTWNGSTCAGSYCHGNFKNGNTANAPIWTGGAGQAACGTCHGLPPGGTHPQRADCGTCHTGYTSSSVPTTTHANGTVDVVAMTCSTCHGTPGRAATTLNPQLAAAPPLGTHGETATTTRAVGAHQKHLGVGSTLSNGVACGECHVVPTSTTHATGTVDLTWGTLAKTGGVTPVWNGATCATTYCHGATLSGGTTKTPSWTGTTPCSGCHGTTTTPMPSTGEHTRRDHSSRPCSVCHGTGYTTTTVSKATHVDGKKTVALRASDTASSITTWTGTTCTPTCHGSKRW